MSFPLVLLLVLQVPDADAPNPAYHPPTICNRYTAPEAEAIERYWRITGRNLPQWGRRLVFPHAPGPFIHRARDGGEGARELVLRPWGLIPWFAMLTINADHHPLMSRMHKPDPKLPPPDQQDKRSVIPVERGEVDLWLGGPVAEAAQLLRAPADDVFVAEPLADTKAEVSRAWPCLAAALRTQACTRSAYRSGITDAKRIESAIADLTSSGLRYTLSGIADINLVESVIPDMKRDEAPLLTPARIEEARELGEKLARLRMARHLRQADAAARAGLARSTAALIEKGDVGRTQAQILRYLEAIAPGLTLLGLLQETDPSLRALSAKELTQRVRALSKSELAKLDF